MKRWIGFLIIFLSVSFPICASYEFKIRLYECEKNKIDKNTLEKFIAPMSIDKEVTRYELLYHYFFCILNDGGVMEVKVLDKPRLVKVKINSLHKRSFSIFINRFVDFLKPSFYTFTDPFSTT